MDPFLPLLNKMIAKIITVESLDPPPISGSAHILVRNAIGYTSYFPLQLTDEQKKSEYLLFIQWTLNITQVFA